MWPVLLDAKISAECVVLAKALVVTHAANNNIIPYSPSLMAFSRINISVSSLNVTYRQLGQEAPIWVHSDIAANNLFLIKG
ncbi:MAG: hypothetical protein DHS20C10_06240 [marine bacterium B5-7]|nr:MAG: hypothetical protein DHS20C10_06240 [marine bacterium B5-7]